MDEKCAGKAGSHPALCGDLGACEGGKNVGNGYGRCEESFMNSLGHADF